MTRASWFVLSVAVVASNASAQDRPLPTRWMSPDGRPRPTHSVPTYIASPKLRIAADVKVLPSPPSPAGRVCLIVGDGVYDSISVKLQRYVQDLEAAGYTVLTYRFAVGTPDDLRTYLVGLYGQAESLVGAQLIGEIPYVVCEMMQDLDGSGEEPLEYEDFACDLFYMDLDGSWSDVLEDGDVHAGNGKYDTWNDSTGLEIWVSRMKTANLPALGTEAVVLNNYFDKNHGYRQRVITPLAEALTYIDDDWAYEPIFAVVPSLLEDVYGSGTVTHVNDPEATTAADYRTNRMPVDRELVYTCSHGSSFAHGYWRNGYSTFEHVFTSDYLSIDPPALFYSLYVCSASDYTAPNYLAGIAAFNQSSGLLAWSSTKTGGMLREEQFYQPLSRGKSFGAAFVNWFNDVRFVSFAPVYFYGMVLIGDASLKPSPQMFVLSLDVPVTAIEDDDLLSGQGTVSLPWPVAADVSVALSSSDETELTVEPVVIIPAGQVSASFSLTVMDDSEIDGTTTATVTATASGWTSAQDSIDVQDDETKTISITLPAHATEGDGAILGAGTVWIPGTYTSDVVVHLYCGDATELTVAATVTILQGDTTANFDLTVQTDGFHDGSQIVTVTATAVGWTSGVANMNILDIDRAPSGVFGCSPGTGSTGSIALFAFVLIGVLRLLRRPRLPGSR